MAIRKANAGSGQLLKEGDELLEVALRTTEEALSQATAQVLGISQELVDAADTRIHLVRPPPLARAEGDIRLDVPDRPAGHLDDACGGGRLTARVRPVLDDGVLEREGGVIRVPPFPNVWPVPPFHHQVVVRGLVSHAADQELPALRQDRHWIPALRA